MNSNLNQRQERYKKHLNKKIRNKYIKYFCIALLSSIVLCFALMLFSHIYAKAFYSGKAHELGDSFGSVNAIISTLAFLGVFLALIMQQKQIELQRKEYELVMLFFNCLYMRDVIKEPQFKGFVEKYHLFNNIRSEKIGEDLFEKFSGEYENSAYNW